MIAKHQNATNIGVGIGIVSVFAWGGLLRQYQNTGDNLMLAVGIPVFTIGLGFFVWGCVNYALAKGYSGWVGLLGLLHIVGLLIMVCLADYCPNGRPLKGSGRRDYDDYDDDFDDRPRRRSRRYDDDEFEDGPRPSRRNEDDRPRPRSHPDDDDDDRLRRRPRRNDDDDEDDDRIRPR